MGAKARRAKKEKKRQEEQRAKAKAKAIELSSPSSELPQPTFTLFGKLPIEIRLQIWSENLPGKQWIVVVVHATGPKGGKKRLTLTTSNRQPWGVLRACKEARDVVVKAMPYQLPVPNGNVPIRYAEGDQICVENFRCLLGLVSRHYHAGQRALGDWAKNVTSMHVPYLKFIDFNRDSHDHYPVIGRTLALFPSLQTLNIMLIEKGDREMFTLWKAGKVHSVTTQSSDGDSPLYGEITGAAIAMGTSVDMMRNAFKICKVTNNAMWEMLRPDVVVMFDVV